jgi:hypothetical protein
MGVLANVIAVGEPSRCLVSSLLEPANAGLFRTVKDKTFVADCLHSTAKDFPVHALTLSHLSTIEEINEIQFLRQQIDLSAHNLLDPNFREHEKKETS